MRVRLRLKRVVQKPRERTKVVPEKQCPLCPKCRTQRLRRLRKPDHIDPFVRGFRSKVERMFGGSLYSCPYCRIQFYDRRKAANATSAG